MLKFKRSVLRPRTGGRALLSGLLTTVAITQFSPVLVWCCFVPLFTLLSTGSVKTAVKAGVYFGAALSLGLFFWMIPGASRFTGHPTLYGWLGLVVAGTFFCLFFGLISGVFSCLKWRGKNHLVCIDTLLISSFFCLGEAFLEKITTGGPWLRFHAGFPLAASRYGIQPAAWLGVYGLSFVVVAVNYLFSLAIRRKAWHGLILPAGVIVLYLASGYLLKLHFEQTRPAGKRITVAILTENTPPETKWNDQTGNQLAQGLLRLSRQAAAAKPDIALWSESAIPWTYRKDDDLVAAVLKNTAPAGLTHILGMNTVTGKENVVYNSAYVITSDGRVSGRYDKQVLLSLIEEPVGGLLLPFMSSGGYSAMPGPGKDPVLTPVGKAGILICNESMQQELARSAVQKGAVFLCNLSNDGWFSDSYLPGAHFYNARLRAVETRKDMVVNSNLGYSGLIRASGDINFMQKTDHPTVALASIEENRSQPLAVRYPWLSLYFCLGLVLALLILRSLSIGQPTK
ncbi:apolipoprotein N-acyltransferase [Arachidicoccus terrestris]|uniref:apolipoprotein N-acyltransferase n=1 Tax=Arachidicoccus terrestris TaxID=2875539 RepID=UPI001CC4FAFF|nr:apolipoprotein N-acyltransferase [Arachidicoccus terrestris]UAY55287.1 apolipoprotein N-acyltransferase [Arachidicoccus terrestris]